MEPPPFGLTGHPQRLALAGEVHARPYEVLATPCRASHLALIDPEAPVSGATADAERAHIEALCRALDVEPPAPDATFFSASLGRFRLRWERHAEFSAYTVFRFDEFDLPFSGTALDLVPADWLAGLPGQLLVGLHVAVEARERNPNDLLRQFDGNQVVGALVNGGAGMAWTDYRLHGDSFGRALVRNLSLTRGQSGRLVQRLVEIETYRMMALLAFPVARRLMPEVATLEAGVTDIVATLAHPAGSGAIGSSPAGSTSIESTALAREQLGRLTALAATSQRLSAETTNRFEAARAYYGLVQQRITALREARLPGIQTFAEFTDRRLDPAMATCASAAARMETLHRHLARVGDLLRTRVNIALEENNHELLASVDRRAHLQYRLQQTVEGLSVVAISYYLVGLIASMAKGAKAAGLPVNADIAALIAVPVVLGMVWVAVHRLRHALKGHGGKDDGR